VPARATTLYSIVVPKVGGDTLFANQQAAYDDLPEAMKKRIEPLYGIHHYGNRTTPTSRAAPRRRRSPTSRKRRCRSSRTRSRGRIR
jgi:taurine dioxygenase